eukprot:UN09266
MRLRKIFSSHRDILTGIYCDDEIVTGSRTLDICCQRIPKTEQCSSTDLVLRCAKVYKIQNKWEIYEFTDILFDKASTNNLMDVKQKICDYMPSYIDMLPQSMRLQFHRYSDFDIGNIDYYCSNYPWTGVDDAEEEEDTQSGDILLFVESKLVQNQKIDLWA